MLELHGRGLYGEFALTYTATTMKRKTIGKMEVNTVQVCLANLRRLLELVGFICMFGSAGYLHLCVCDGTAGRWIGAHE